MRDTKEKLSTLTITLHWIVGLSVIILAVIGVYIQIVLQ
jgi:cytochrome b561